MPWFGLENMVTLIIIHVRPEGNREWQGWIQEEKELSWERSKGGGEGRKSEWEEESKEQSGGNEWIPEMLVNLDMAGLG